MIHNSSYTKKLIIFLIIFVGIFGLVKTIQITNSATANNIYLDEVRFYNRVLSLAEIAVQYRAGAGRMKVNTPITLAGPQSGLVGNWSFNGQDTTWTSATAGTTNDLSGNGNTGTMTNMSRSASPVPGISGQALNFDGVDDYINIASHASIDNLATSSISMWFKARTDEGTFLVKDADDTAALYINTLPGRRLGFTRKYSGDDLMLLCAGPSYTLNQWTHFIGTFSGANSDNAHIYVNGIECSYETRDSATLVLMTEAGQPINIINRNAPWGVILDEVRIYNRSLSSDEIQQLYRQQSGKVKFKN